MSEEISLYQAKATLSALVRNHLALDPLSGAAFLGLFNKAESLSRIPNQLFMSAIFPPSWRLAATVPVDTLIRDAATIRQRLDERLKDGSEDENSEEEED